MLVLGSAQAQPTLPTFREPVVFDVGSFPYGLAAADLLGNGSLHEIVVANGDFDATACNGGDGGDPGAGPNGTVSVLRNTGAWETDPGAGLVLEQTIPICDSCGPAEIAVADIDMMDGPDLIVSAAGTTGPGIYVCYNDGTGHFPLVQYFPTPLPVRGLLAKDFDNDGWIDVATGVDYCVDAPDTDKVYFLFNKGTGTYDSFDSNDPIFFKEIDLGTLEERPPCDIVAADFFHLTLGPPHPDIVSANMWDNSYTEIRNLGNRVLNAHTTEKPDGCPYTAWEFEVITTERFNGDAFDDFAVTEYASDHVDIFLGHGNGTYTSYCDDPDLRIPVGPGFCWGIEGGHLNGDSKADLAVTLLDSDQVHVLVGNGDGTFPVDERFSVVPQNAVAFTPIMVIIADLDQDGIKDIVTTNHNTDNISVLINDLVVVPGTGP